jgi:hypothetical protein
VFLRSKRGLEYGVSTTRVQMANATVKLSETGIQPSRLIGAGNVRSGKVGISLFEQVGV